MVLARCDKYKQFYEHIENGDQMYHYDEDKHERIIAKLKQQNYQSRRNRYVGVGFRSARR
jgi:uncharacterized membrane-anchored protein YhcB (DUF1043 family)